VIESPSDTGPTRTARAALTHAFEAASAYLQSRDSRPVWPTATIESLRAALGGPLQRLPIDAGVVLDDLVRAAEPGLVATTGPRYFGFVTGGALPATVGADWLAAVWDQPAALYVLSPAAAVVEEVAGAWLLEVLGLPSTASVGFVTGCHMANFTALAAARLEVLRRAGWDLDQNGLQGSPPIRVLVGNEVHVSVVGALRMLGIGSRQIERVDADEQGRMRPASLERALQSPTGPTIVCAQAGNVNTGAFDPLDEIAGAASRHGAWLHVDGAFGLWASACAALRPHMRGVERADSWATDAHKWLNVPYDSGISIVRDAAAHHAAMTLGAAYYVETAGAERDPYNWVAESSRRARGFPIYAALRELGRDGLAEMIDRGCSIARRMADGLREAPGVTILNDVVLNQVLVRFGDDDRTDATIAAAQRDGTCWVGGTTWKGVRAMRVSVSSWATTDEDADRSVAAILRCAGCAA